MASLPAEAPLLSARSGRVKAARRLARRVSRAEHRLFLVEGPQAVREALTLSGCVREVFAVPEAAATHPDLVAAAAEAGAPWQPVDGAALASLAETVSPQGLVAVCRFLDEPFVVLLERAPRLLAVCAAGQPRWSSHPLKLRPPKSIRPGQPSANRPLGKKVFARSAAFAGSGRRPSDGPPLEAHAAVH